MGREEMGRSTDATPVADPDNDPYAEPTGRRTRSIAIHPKGRVMILATTKVEDVDRFLAAFDEYRSQHHA